MARTIAKDHDQKREHILRRAAQVFAERGCANASMSEVARECGISKANIYHYYSSKDALLFDILDSGLSALHAELSELSKDKPAAERLHDFTRVTLLSYEGLDAKHEIQSEGIALLAQEQQNVLKGYQRDMVQWLSDILLELSPTAFAGDARKLREAAMSVFGMLNWHFMWNRGAGAEDRTRYAALVAELTMGGLAKL